MTPDKLAAWLTEDILLRRVPVRKSKGKGEGGQSRSRSRQPQHQRQLQQEQAQADAAALAEVKTLAEALEVPLSEAVELLADDREGYVPPIALAPTLEAAEELQGSLFTKGTVDSYVAAVIEL